MEGRSEFKKGLWTVEEDGLLMDYVKGHGKGKWNRVAKETGLKRSGKSCRLRWMNYLTPGIKRGDFSEEEDDLIIRLHNLLGNRWSLIAGRVPGRTDNQVKNHWNTHLSKRLGIKWRKNKVSAGSSRFSIKLEDKCKAPLSASSSFTPPPTCNEKAVVKTAAETISMNAIGFTTTNYWENSFWFSHDDPNTYSSNFMELLDESLNFIFHGL